MGLGRGRKYDITAVIKWLINYHVSLAQEHFNSKLAGGTDGDWSIRKLAAQALREELELEKERGTLVNVEDASKELSRNLTAVRAALLSFPSRASAYCVGITDELAMREVLDTQIELLMNSIIKSVEVDVIDDAEDEEHDDETEE
jgi:phage terminase Nu1 subunit (DNA packaging protein)